VTAPTPKYEFVKAAPLIPGVRAGESLAERARFRNWLVSWLVLPNLPYLPATILGGPPLLGQLAQWSGLGFALGAAAVIAALIVPGVVLVIRARRRECAPPAVSAPTM